MLGHSTNIRKLVILLLAVAPTMAFADDTTRAFVLVRHAHDYKKIEGVKESDLWQKKCSEANEDGAAVCNGNNKWVYNFRDRQARDVELPWRRLNEDGRREARKLAEVLPQWLQDNNYSPIRRVVTMNPKSKDFTQNPFQTVYPLVREVESAYINDAEDYSYHAQPYVRFKFMNNMPDDELHYESLVDQRGNYSTVICWDAQGLWGDKIKINNEKVWPPEPSDKSIFQRLIPGQISSVPGKGEDIYIVTYNSSDKKFNLVETLKLSEL